MIVHILSQTEDERKTVSDLLDFSLLIYFFYFVKKTVFATFAHYILNNRLFFSGMIY